MNEKMTPQNIVERPPLIYIPETKERLPLGKNPELVDFLAKRLARRWLEQAEHAVESSLNGK